MFQWAILSSGCKGKGRKRSISEHTPVSFLCYPVFLLCWPLSLFPFSLSFTYSVLTPSILFPAATDRDFPSSGFCSDLAPSPVAPTHSVPFCATRQWYQPPRSPAYRWATDTFQIFFWLKCAKIHRDGQSLSPVPLFPSFHEPMEETVAVKRATIKLSHLAAERLRLKSGSCLPAERLEDDLLDFISTSL